MKGEACLGCRKLNRSNPFAMELRLNFGQIWMLGDIEIFLYFS